MEWLTAFGSAMGGAAIPVVLFLFILNRQSTTIQEVKSGLKKKVATKDCGGQPCEDIKDVKEVLQGKLGETGVVAKVENIEKVVMEIRKHQVVNGGQS